MGRDFSPHAALCPSLTQNYLLGSTLKSCLLVLYLVHFPKRANAQGTMALGPVNLFSVLIIHWLQLLEVQTENKMKQGKRHLNVELHGDQHSQKQHKHRYNSTSLEISVQDYFCHRLGRKPYRINLLDFCGLCWI